MSFHPTPPATLPEDLVDAIEARSPEELRPVANYADALAEHRDREASLEDEATDGDEMNDEDETDERDRSHGGDESEQRDGAADDLPDDVPSKATTVKEINDNRYYYWQWREGDQVKSKYKSPVDPSK